MNEISTANGLTWLIKTTFCRIFFRITDTDIDISTCFYISWVNSKTFIKLPL